MQSPDAAEHPSRPWPMLRRRLCAIALACGTLALGGRAAHGQATAQPPAPAITLTISRETEDNPLTDVSVAVVSEAFRRAGIALAFLRLPLTRSAEMVVRGEVDGELHRISLVVERYPNLMLVPTPVNRVDVMIYGTSPSLPSQSREQIHRLPVVIQRGVYVLSKYSEGMHVSDTATLDSAMEMLLNGHGEILMLAYTDAEFWLAHRPVGASRATGPSPGIIRWPHPWASEPLYLVLNRKHAELVPRLNGALLAMQKEGVIEREYRKGLEKANIPPLEPEPMTSPTRKPGRG